jgi:GNAT superfamily N-acetyltransferase
MRLRVRLRVPSSTWFDRIWDQLSPAKQRSIVRLLVVKLIVRREREAMRHVTSLSMSVRKELHNRGVGSALLARAIEWAKATGTVLEIPQRFHLYRKFGFEEEGPCRGAIYQNGEFLDDLIMAS